VPRPSPIASSGEHHHHQIRPCSSSLSGGGEHHHQQRATMRPILMKGHERPLTFLRYNRDGDLLFSCADNGDRLGTYRGHNGAVWTCDVSRDSARLITASADQTAKLWEVSTGKELFSFRFDAPARSVEFAIGDALAVITTDNFMDHVPTVQVKHIAEDIDDR
jgi:translation initiation factor 3 subunit I